MQWWDALWGTHKCKVICFDKQIILAQSLKKEMTLTFVKASELAKRVLLDEGPIEQWKEAKCKDYMNALAIFEM